MKNDVKESFVKEIFNPNSKIRFGTDEFFHELLIKAENGKIKFYKSFFDK